MSAVSRPGRVLLVVNPVARSVTRPVVEVIEKALAADFKLEVHETNARGHATELAREAVGRDFDLVVAFSGDGTINEVVNGLVGSDVALGLIPGGATNVLARGLGLPDDPVEATVRLLHAVVEGPPRRISVGDASGRRFTFSCGVGLDASAMARLSRKNLTTRRSYEWAALFAVLRAGVGTYAGRKPDLRVRVDGRELPGSITVLIGNAHPYAYFKRWTLKLTPDAEAAEGLDVLSARKLTRRGLPRLVWQVFVTASHTKAKHIDYLHDASHVEIEGTAPFPVQVDGDYLGLRDRLEVAVVRDALPVYV
ncbi:MAG: diacylglycerol kinase family lipid kinase [Actinobacteria bacterium]|nr:diacylglycerol kinase family lipid kinase [Actinomycetota bacterium]